MRKGIVKSKKVRREEKNMKHGKNPTVKQKKLLKSYGLNCQNWLVVTEDNKEIKIIHRHTDTVRVIKKV